MFADRTIAKLQKMMFVLFKAGYIQEAALVANILHNRKGRTT